MNHYAGFEAREKQDKWRIFSLSRYVADDFLLEKSLKIHTIASIALINQIFVTCLLFQERF